jgi:uroporphyrinogen-III decarboxylase
MTPMFTKQEWRDMVKAILKAGQETEKWRKVQGSLEADMYDLGYPPNGHGGGAGGAPFDQISDFFRGMRGAMTDMYRQPENLLRMLNQLSNDAMKRVQPANPDTPGNPKRLFIALHRGAETFMSRKQFEKFYWPGLKAAMLKSIEMGFIPMPFCEGKYGDRLEYFLELPKGKVVAHFDLTDMHRAKDVLRDHTCIMGNVPSPLLQFGKPHEVEDYCKDLIKYCGKGGGFILTNGSSTDTSDPALVKVMCDSTKKFKV